MKCIRPDLLLSRFTEPLQVDANDPGTYALFDEAAAVAIEIVAKSVWVPKS